MLSQGAATTELALGQVKSVANGLKLLDDTELAALNNGSANLRDVLAAKGVPLAGEGEAYMIKSAAQFNQMTATSRVLMAVVVLLISAAGAVFALLGISAPFRARNQVERVMLWTLMLASSIAILTTIGIVGSMLSEAIRFFNSVSPASFFFGTVWDPRFAAAVSEATQGQFGLLPLLAGTLYIAFVAMLFAVPIGLFAAIYMSEYARPAVRSIAKPLLEILAGIPTIVYGFFALVTVGPFRCRTTSSPRCRVPCATVRSGWVPPGRKRSNRSNYVSFIQAQSVLTAGIVMGIMLIPFVSSRDKTIHLGGNIAQVRSCRSCGSRCAGTIAG